MNTINDSTHNLRCFNLLSTLFDIINNNDDNDTNNTIAKFLLTHIDHLEDMSIYDVADQCYVSRSSVQRFIKFIGFESYTNIKDRLLEAKIHAQRYKNYADKEEFEEYFASRMVRMTNSINQMCDEQDVDHIVKKIHDAKNVVICSATNASGCAFDFQEGMLGLGKLIRVITTSSISEPILNDLSEDDFLIVISSTGNFAIATLNEIKNVKAYKLLITLNKEETFRLVYDDIFYMNDKQYASDRILIGIQNIFTKYGASYLFDIIFSRYVRTYKQEAKKI